ncbi:MAG: type III-B CRISPR-associated protein Cas10/Cmr2 [Fimbriimonadales bacterium]
MQYLLGIAIGPVQEFIAAARRTADLTAGSRLLVETAQAIAQTLERQGATLIFPAASHLPAPNKLLCIVADEPHKIAQIAKDAALKHLCDQWEKAYGQIPKVQQLIDTDLVNWQLENFLEFYAAWVSLKEMPYSEARKRLEGIMAGRKALRNFQQPYQYPQRPKSPLDPSMDSVFRTETHGKGFSAPAQAQEDRALSLKPRETLDAISLIKRALGQRDVPSTDKIAIRAIESILPQEALQDYRTLLKRQEQLEVDHFGDLLFQRNWRPQEANLSDADYANIEKCASNLRRALREHGIPQEPLSYYAILVADGDNMGATLNQLQTPEQHREFSSRVAGFAEQAKGVVDNHRGYLVYCGGDDVLALLPTNCALECAWELRQAFEQTLADVMPKGRTATLSAGIAIVHAMENLQVAIGWAREAEQQAKRTRDALAVIRQPRSGGRNCYSAPWSCYHEWEQWINAFHRGLADKLPYELRQLAQEYRAINPPVEVLRAEATRVLKRKQKPDETLAIPEWIDSVDALDKFAEMLLIARFLASYRPKETRR